jgi:hypothetical protein
MIFQDLIYSATKIIAEAKMKWKKKNREAIIIKYTDLRWFVD